MRGRTPAPTALKLMKGIRRKDRLPTREPKPKRMIPSPPAHLSPAAAIAWGSMSARFDRLGVLTENEVEALEQLCENYAEIVDLRQDIFANGRFEKVRTTAGEVLDRPRAQYMALRDAEKRFQSKMNDFGMTPSARSRVTAATDDDADPAKKYFG